MSRLSLLPLLLLLALSLSEGRVVSRCELRDEISERITLRRNQEYILSRVICEVERRSDLNTALVREYEREVFNMENKTSISVQSVQFYGIFQFSDAKFCDSKFNGTENKKCRDICDVFGDEDISDDVECFIRSKLFWEVFRQATRKCKFRRNLNNFFRDCEAGQTPKPAPQIFVRQYMSGGTYI